MLFTLPRRAAATIQGCAPPARCLWLREQVIGTPLWLSVRDGGAAVQHPPHSTVTAVPESDVTLQRGNCVVLRCWPAEAVNTRDEPTEGTAACR